MVGKYEIGAKAYLKAVLHAAKYKTCAVNGLLIGRVKGDGLDNFSLQILECVPLFHNHLALLPMLEVALLQVEEHFSTVDGGLQIVGYYHANERFDDFELNAVARKIGDHIIRYCPQAVILMLDNKQLAALPKSGSRKPVMQLYMRDVSRVWKQGGTTAELVFQDTTTNNLLEAYMADGRQRLVVDFDEHLDDISKFRIMHCQSIFRCKCPAVDIKRGRIVDCKALCLVSILMNGYISEILFTKTKKRP